MLNRFKTALFSAVGGIESIPAGNNSGPHSDREDEGLGPKFPYSRPFFLNFQTIDEVRVSADHHVRPIIVPRDISGIPYNAGYAECVNAGKSQWNEDQAYVQRRILRRPGDHGVDAPELPYVYFGLFDGHAGVGAALAAANQLHHIIHEKLVDVLDEFLPKSVTTTESHPLGNITFLNKPVSHDALIIGALESSFWEMDDIISKDRERYQAAGGCTALVALLLLGKLYVSNAGDSRAVLCQKIPENQLPRSHIDKSDQSVAQAKNIRRSSAANSGELLNASIEETRKKPHSNSNESAESQSTMPSEHIPLETTTAEMEKQSATKHSGQVKKCDKIKYTPVATAMSHDFTPETERQRIRAVGAIQPILLGSEFTCREYARRPSQRDLGRRILYREPFMSGWTYKTLTHHDLKIPIITGEGKRSRVMGTIGVTRGFGDHDLRALNTKLLIKPFLTPQPEVMILDLTTKQSSEEADLGVLVMGTDGLWDVTDNNTAAEIVCKSLRQFPHGKHRYTSAAQELVAHSRGKLVEHRSWRTTESRPATIDDISVFVIPLAPYRAEYLEWKSKYKSGKHGVTVPLSEQVTEVENK